MAEARCANCGGRFLKKNGQHRYCKLACRLSDSPGPRAKYGYRHQKSRKAVFQLVRSGSATCARCGEPIAPDEPWDLDHDDDVPGAYLGASHRGCNRATAKPMEYVDDPEAGIFWSAYPDPDTGKPWRLSRRW